MSKKHKRYYEFVTTYNFKRDVEQANFFYVGYANGYADSQEDNYNESDKSEQIAKLKQENEKLQRNITEYDRWLSKGLWISIPEFDDYMKLKQENEKLRSLIKEIYDCAAFNENYFGYSVIEKAQSILNKENV